MELIEYSPDQLFDIVVETIKYGKQKYHAHYDETVKKAKFYKQIMTGDDQEELLIKYKDAETGTQKQQRVKLTNSRTQYASGKIWSVFNEVSRSDNVVEVIKYPEDNDTNNEKLEEIHDRLKKFHGYENALQYTYEAIKRYNFYDPNAFLVVNFTPFDHTKSKTEFVYPVEVTSEQAIRYEYSNGILIYLLFFKDIYWETVDDNGKPKTEKGKHYFLYAKDVAYEFIQLPEKDPELKPGFAPIQINTIPENNMYNQDGKPVMFQWTRHELKSKRIPVIRTGYIHDAANQRATCVSPMQPAEKLLLDLIWTKSEYDLAKALHWFYQKFIYAPACEFEHEEHGHCNGGNLSISGEVCPECDGTGMMIHTTVQDVIVLKLPQDAADVVPLSNMVHYENIDITIGKHLQEDYQTIETDIFKAVFNSQAFDRSEVAVTATEKNLDLRAVKNALIDFGNHISRVYKFIVQMTAIYLDNDEELIIQHKHPKDFKFYDVDSLVKQRNDAVTAGAPYQVIRNIDLQILEMQHLDDPEVVTMMAAKEKFKPFREKSESERMFVLTQLSKDDYHRILWVYFEDIMAEIWAEDKDRDTPWYKLPYIQQKEIVEAKVETMQEDIKAQQKEAAKLMPFRGIGEGQEEEEDEQEEGAAA